MALNRKEMRRYSEWVARIVGRMGEAQRRLRDRQEGGEIAELTEKAYNALLALRLAAHYQSCEKAGQVNEREAGDEPPAANRGA